MKTTVLTAIAIQTEVFSLRECSTIPLQRISSVAPWTIKPPSKRIIIRISTFSNKPQYSMLPVKTIVPTDNASRITPMIAPIK